MNLRKYRIGDHAALIAIYQACDLSRSWRANYPPCPPMDEEKLQDWIKGGVVAPLHTWVAEVDGRGVGFLCLKSFISRPESIAAIVPTPGFWGNWESMLCVHPAYQGNGIGRALLYRGLEALQRDRAKRILAWVFDENKRGINFLRRGGFVERPVLRAEDRRIAYEIRFYIQDFNAIPEVRKSTRVRCRNLVEGDLDELGRFLQRMDRMKAAPPPDEVAQTIYSVRYRHFVAEEGNDIVGLFSTWYNGELVLPGVLPECQGTGVGSALMDYTLRTMKEIGYPWATASSAVDLEGAHKLYARFGFKRTRRLLLLERRLD